MDVTTIPPPASIGRLASLGARLDVTEQEEGHKLASPTPDPIYTAETVIARLEEAGATLFCIRPERLGPAGYPIAWSVAEFVEGERWRGLPEPTPEAITRMDEAYRWINELVPEVRSRRILHARSLVHPIRRHHLMSWRMLGKKLKISHVGAMKAHAVAANRLADALNQRFCLPVTGVTT